MKAGPVAAMIALLLIGVWLVLQPTLEKGRRIDPTAHRFVLELGAETVAVEQRAAAGGGFDYRFVGRADLDALGWVDGARYQEVVAAELTAWEGRPGLERGLLGFFNITGWGKLAWVLLGLGGQGAFFGRMLVQWVASEKSRASVVPEAFWWLSLVGGLSLFAYFVWRVDFVGVLGQSTGIVVYVRNLRLIRKQQRREARLAAAGPAGQVAGPAGPDGAQATTGAVHAGTR